MQVTMIPLERIKGHAFQIRSTPDELSQELLESIRVHGVKQPILLRPRDDFYEVVAGVRRVYACKKLGMARIPAIIEALDDKAAFEVALTENIQRKTLSPVEEAEAFLAYIDKYKLGSITELARRISKTPAHIVSRLKLLELPDEITREIFPGEKLSVSHAEELLRLREPEQMKQLAKAIVEKELDRNETANVVELVKYHGVPVRRAVEAVEASSRLEEEARKMAEQVRQAIVRAEPEVFQQIVEAAHKQMRDFARQLGPIARQEELLPRGAGKLGVKPEDVVIEVDTGEIWECPVCRKRYRPIHIKPDNRHRFEEAF